MFEPMPAGAIGTDRWKKNKWWKRANKTLISVGSNESFVRSNNMEDSSCYTMFNKSQRQEQSTLTRFFGGSRSEETQKRAQVVVSSKEGRTPVVTPRHWKRQRDDSITAAPHKSRFGTCPICQSSFPSFKLPSHAEECTGETVLPPLSPLELSASSIKRTQSKYPANSSSTTSSNNDSHFHHSKKHTALAGEKPAFHPPLNLRWNPSSPSSLPEFPPGLYFFPDFISMDEERQLLQYLDDPNALPVWKMGRFNGQQCGKRWGVHCNLRDRRVDSPKHPLPLWLTSMIVPKLYQLDCWETLLAKQKQKGNISSLAAAAALAFTPNEANAIDYRRQRGDWLHAHVDDRKLSTGIIANLSMAGDCYMTFADTKNANGDNNKYRVHLPRRGLQILTGPARYNYTHAIANADLLSDRRVSITMRESPLTQHLPLSLSSPLGQSSGMNHTTTPKIDSLFPKELK